MASATPPPRPKPAFDRCQLPTRVADAVWSGTELGASEGRTVPTGFTALDGALPGSGWPTLNLSEILLPQAALCEWRLLERAVPGLLAEKGSCLYLVAPPKQPHALGLSQLGVRPEQLVWIDAAGPADRLWVTEQLIKSDPAGAVMAWLPQARPEQIRRLQVHAHSCDAPVFLFRPETALRDTSPAPLRLSVQLGEGWDIDVRIRKRRGASFDEVLRLPAMPANLGKVIPPRLRSFQPGRVVREEVPYALGSPITSPAAEFRVAS